MPVRLTGPCCSSLTNSIDGTADILAHLCAETGQPLFRFNIDLWSDYAFAWTPSGFAMRDPTGRTVESDAVTACLWRRPSLQETPAWRGGSEADRAATEAELHCIVREIAEWAQVRGRLRLIEPNAPRRVGRLAQMRVAKHYFPVPEWTVGWGFRRQGETQVVKRFTPEPVGEEEHRYIFVRSVDASRLSPDYPWLTQVSVADARDATVLFVHGACFGFAMRRTRAELGVEDWRTLTDEDRNGWEAWDLPSETEAAVRRLDGRSRAALWPLGLPADRRRDSFSRGQSERPVRLARHAGYLAAAPCRVGRRA